MFKHTDFVALGFGTMAGCAILAMMLLSPVSASNYDASSGYLPAEIINQGTAVESVPADSFGDSGLAQTFPKEEFALNLEEESVKMYY